VKNEKKCNPLSIRSVKSYLVYFLGMFVSISLLKFIISEEPNTFLFCFLPMIPMISFLYFTDDNFYGFGLIGLILKKIKNYHRMF